MTRVSCPSCGSSTGLGDIHCFKCGYINKYKATPGYFTEYVKRTEQVLKLRDNIVLAPNRFAPKALEWLYKASIYDETIVKQRIAYCPDINKVLVPAFKDEVLKFYQLRSLKDEDKAKYVTYGSCSNYKILYNDHDNTRLVITEDHLSGMRIRPYENVACLSGTTLSYSFIETLLDNYDEFIFWLDPDKPGIDALNKNANRLKWYSSKYNVRRMFTRKKPIEYRFYKVNYKEIVLDPKYYLNNEIVNILKNKVVKL